MKVVLLCMSLVVLKKKKRRLYTAFTYMWRNLLSTTVHVERSLRVFPTQMTVAAMLHTALTWYRYLSIYVVSIHTDIWILDSSTLLLLLLLQALTVFLHIRWSRQPQPLLSLSLDVLLNLNQYQILLISRLFFFPYWNHSPSKTSSPSKEEASDEFSLAISSK